MTAACEHGYAESDDCPRCGVSFSAPARPVVMHSRWEPSSTTMGPRGRVLFTAALVLPMLICIYGLALAFEHEGNVFFALPLCVLLVVSYLVLPDVWARTPRTKRT